MPTSFLIFRAGPLCCVRPCACSKILFPIAHLRNEAQDARPTCPRSSFVFKFERPLLQLFGVEFFRRAPAGPGVYVFRGELGRVLYVGQSKNLRARLSYYKNAQPEREPRRIIRLVHQTKSIELECCQSPEAAQAREVHLIQEHRPRFNVQHALSRTYSFFAVGPGGIRLSMDETVAHGEKVIGAFKNRGLCRHALFAIARHLWAAPRHLQCIFEFPLAISNSRANEVRLELEGSTRDELMGLLRGEADAFVARAKALAERSTDSFLKRVLEQDHSTLLEFFALAVRMRKLREKVGVVEILRQAQVDRVRFHRGAPPEQ